MLIWVANLLSRSDIIANASMFSKTWKDASDEEAEAKSFWDELFLVYGTPRKNVARFEVPVKRDGRADGYIDLLWKGKLLVEHKSRGKSLVEARKQAQEYVLHLKPADRPEWLVVSDFENFEVINQKTGDEQKFKLSEFAGKIDTLGFIGGFTPKKPSTSAPVNIKAVELLGDIYDALKAGGYPQHHLAPLLVRILFSLFAEDTAIFDPEQFRTLILDNTTESGSDLGPLLDAFFEILNTPDANRQKLAPDYLKAFPYVNGALFDHRLPNAAMSKDMRDALLKATEFDWTQISPAIFGSLFQSVMEGAERRALGAHYTSEDDILKLIKPLFLDELEAELDAILADKSTKRNSRLDEYHTKLASLRFLDPACGCGNFLIIAYRELRRLETKLLNERYKGTAALDISLFVKLNVDMMYGIELEEFPAEIAKVGMWLMDHICNTELAATFGKSFTRLPLNKSATIKCANALTIDWNTVLPASQCSYIMGNPPFVGARVMNNEQKLEIKSLFPKSINSGDLDYVAGWYSKTISYIAQRAIPFAFVSTNSITQGEQVGILWPYILNHGYSIQFAHRTFRWKSEARGAASVHVVIICLCRADRSVKLIFDHHDHSVRTYKASNISPYLVDAANIIITSSSQPICTVPAIAMGNQPVDNGNYIFTTAERDDFISKEPGSAILFKKFLGAEEYLNGIERWILWLGNTPPSTLKALPLVLDRIKAVRDFRHASRRKQTNSKAAFPTRFMTENIPVDPYLVLPEVSSERRKYIPIGYLAPDILASNKLRIFPNATLWHFGVLQSLMHSAWMRQVTGRLKSDYQYSVTIVYNNFVWPECTNDAQIRNVEAASQKVLDARMKYPTETLANLYDPNLMPADLVKAHDALDRAVDACYRKQPFTSEMERVQFLFKLYEEKTAPLAIAATKRSKRKTTTLQ